MDSLVPRQYLFSIPAGDYYETDPYVVWYQKTNNAKYLDLSRITHCPPSIVNLQKCCPYCVNSSNPIMKWLSPIKTPNTVIIANAFRERCCIIKAIIQLLLCIYSSIGLFCNDALLITFLPGNY